jgi:hypothetical protein
MTIRRTHEVNDPAAMWRNALSTFLSASVEAVTAWLHQECARSADAEHSVVPDQSAVTAAAQLLGVDRLATVDQIRSAFRERVKAELQTGTFHDQAGDATDERAQLLIAAKNLLIDHAVALEVANG